MNRTIGFLVTVFIVVGLALPAINLPSVSAQTTCPAGQYPSGSTCTPCPAVTTVSCPDGQISTLDSSVMCPYYKCPVSSPSPSPTYSQSPSPTYSCPTPSSFPCPAGSISKLTTPTSAGCPYYVCESTTGTSPSPSPTSVGSCTLGAPSYCTSQGTCEYVGNYWCKSNVGGEYCIQSSTKTACPGYGTSPSPSPTFSCSPSTPQHCSTTQACEGIGGKWNTVTNHCEGSTSGSCSSSSPGYCATQPTCEGVGNYWCKTIYGNPYCTQLSTKSACPISTASPSLSPSPTYSPKPTSSPDWYVCSKDQYWNCDTETKCKGAGINWCTYKDAKTGQSNSYCNQYQCPSNTCSAKESWNCFDESSCKSAGVNWCKYSWGAQCESYSCPTTTPQPIVCPAVYYPPKACQPGEQYEPTFDDRGCSTGGNCVKKDTCSYDWKPVCGVDDRTYQNSCKAQAVGVKVDHDGECGYKFKCDDSFVEEHARKCTANGGTPEKYTRPDGCADIWCKGLKPTPLPTIAPPPGCKLMGEDPLTGTRTYDCGGKPQSCKPLEDYERSYLKDKCYANNGKPEYRKDYTGCEYLDCLFDDRDKFRFSCPTENQVKAVEEKCNRQGLKTDYEVVNGLKGEQCKIAKCKQLKDRTCPPLPAAPAGALCPIGTEERIVIGEEGCDVLKCIPKEEVQCRPLPSAEAFVGCKEKGGELVVKQNEKGCVVLEECVRRGDEDEIEFEEVKEVPDSGEVLQLALKLETISISLKEFGKKIDAISKFYEKEGEKENAERFNRVKGLLVSAGDEVNKIRTELKDKLSKLTKEDIAAFKYRLKYVKQIIFKDVLYLMLGGEEAKKEVLKTEDCGTSIGCFDKALRNCRPAKMKTEISTDLTIEPVIVGLEGDLCVAKVTGGADSMTCKLKDYALGMGNPEVNVLPYCEGSLKAKLQSSNSQPPTVATTPAAASPVTATSPTVS